MPTYDILPAIDTTFPSKSLNPARTSFNNLPPEIISRILENVIIAEANGSPNNYCSTMQAFARKLTTCSAFYDVGIPILYKHAAFADSYNFDRFLKSIEITGYGRFTKTLDFSGFTSVGLGRTARMNDKIELLTCRTIARALDLCPNLREFLASENIEKDIDATVLLKLFYQMKHVRSLDFCGATDRLFIEALNKVASVETFAFSSITNLSLHGCSTIPPLVIESLLSRLPKLKKLDLTHTQITTLSTVPDSVRLTHLSLSKCVRLSSNEYLKFFLINKKAVKNLQWLNLLFDVTRPAPISSNDLTLILHYLPKSLVYLNLYGLPVQHLDDISKITSLRALSLGYVNVPFNDLQSKVLNSLPALQYLDLSGNPNVNMWTVHEFLEAKSSVQVFEFSADFLRKMSKMPGFDIVLTQGKRGWLRRNASTARKTIESVSPSQSPTQTKRFTFSDYAKTRMSRSVSPASPKLPATQPIDPIGTYEWRNAARKINVCSYGIGGIMNHPGSCRERGIYLYYGYRK